MKTNGKKSLNDFLGAFHGLGGNTAPKVVPYTFDEVVAGLNGVVANDWAAFLQQRLEVLTPDAPLGGVTNGGYRLAYQETQNGWSAMGGVDFWYSLGLHVGQSGTVGDVLHAGLSDKAGIGPGMKIIAVNGRAYSVEMLRAAIRDAKTTQDPIELIVENTSFFKVIKLDWHGGERFPVLERVSGTPDRLDDILKGMTK